MTKIILVVGGGFSGTTAIIHLLRTAIREGKDSRRDERIQVRWIDKRNSFGRGLPYGEQPADGQDAFLLNIPAHMMSPISDEPDLYINWLAVNAPNYNEYSFTPRTLYGRFLLDVLADQERQANKQGLNINVTREEDEVLDVQRAAAQLVVSFKNRRAPVVCDTILLAAGHERVDQFKHFAEFPGYIANPYMLDDYRRAVAAVEGAQAALIVGGGSSSIDSIRAFERSNFKGRYVVVSSSPVPQWGWDARLYKQHPPDFYQPRHLTPEAATSCASFAELKSLLDDEVAYALNNGFGYGSVYFGLKPHRLFGGADTSTACRQQFLHAFFQCRKAVSAPESVELLEQLNEQGRLTRVLARVAADCVTTSDDRFTLALQDGNRLQGDLLVNCAQVVRAYELPLRNPLLANLRQKGLLRLSEAGLLESVDGIGIFPVGPMAAPPEGGPRYLWSARFFRDEIRMQAEAMVARVNAASELRNVVALQREEAVPLSMNSPTAPSLSQ